MGYQLAIILSVKMASEPFSDVLKKLVLAIWRVIKPFKKQLRSATNRTARSIVYHLFIIYIF